MIAEDENAWPVSAEAMIRRDLEQVGVQVERLNDLCLRGAYAPDAIPVLTKWLSLTENWLLASCLARILTMPWARTAFAARALCDKFESAPNNGHWLTTKWAIANALSMCATSEQGDRIAEYLRDPRYGNARQMLCDALVRTKYPNALPVLTERLQDMPLHAISALRSLKNPTAIPIISPFLVDSRPHVRRAAKKAIERLGSIGGQ